MAKITPMWLTDGMRGRADRTSNTYTKIDRVTGRVYAVTLRNPVSGKDFNNAQITANNKFGALCMGVAAWCKLAKAAAEGSADRNQYEKFQKAVKSQHVYPTVRALIMGKRYATVSADLSSVTIKNGDYTKTVEFEFNARPLIEGAPSEEFEGSNGSSGSSSEQGGNGSQQGGSNGSEQGSNGSQTPSQPAQGGSDASGDFTITAAVGNDGGGSVTIKKNGVAVEGSSVQASATDTVTLTAVEDSGYQFLGWADGNSDNPRTITPSADATFTASFMDLSNV